MKKKKTVGAIASELQQKAPETLDPVEIQREVHKDYIDNLQWSVMHAKKEVDCSHLIGQGRGHDDCANRLPIEGDFYVVVTTKKEKLLQNVLRNYFSERKTCPTPDYDQSVYKYHDASGNLEYLWTIPDIYTCEAFARNPGLVLKEEQLLLEFVLNFANGELLRLCRKLNGENLETGIVLEGR